MNHKEKILLGLDVHAKVGAEIGALCRPVVTRKDGTVYYIDHASTEDLRQKYKNDPNVDVDALVDVDAVWGKKSLSEALGDKRVDYVVASHVVEHVPDLVSWFAEISTILTPTGQLRLAVPDKRFTFDLVRQESRLSDVLAAYLVRARIPQPQPIIDHFLNVRYDVSAGEIWNGFTSYGRQAHTFADAMNVARDAFENGNYHDVHCWVFTPASFAIICRQLVEYGVLRMSCINFIDTARNELEFHVHMQECADVDEAINSWRKMEEAATSVAPTAVPMAPHPHKVLALKVRRRLYGLARRILR